MNFASTHVYTYDLSDEECVSEDELEHGMSARFEKKKKKKNFLDSDKTFLGVLDLDRLRVPNVKSPTIALRLSQSF